MCPTNLIPDIKTNLFMKLLTATNRHALDTGILLLRCITGLILFVAGAGKALGWFGGIGMATTTSMFQSGMNLSAFWAYLSTYAEFIGGALLIIGLATRFAALALTINMVVATITVGTKNFFMGGGAYPCLLAVCCLLLLLSGPMAYSLDAVLAKNKKPSR